MKGFALTTNVLIGGAIVGALFLWGFVGLVFGGSVDFDWPQRYPLQFLVVCLVAPVLEEYVFRGVLFEAIQRRWVWRWPDRGEASLSIANLITTALFILLHYITRDPITAAIVLLPSLYLGLVKEVSGKIGVCIFVHVFWNIVWALGLREVMTW